MAAQKQGDQLERTFSSYARIQDVVLKTYLGRWTIGRSGERGSGISVLPARDDDDDDDKPVWYDQNTDLNLSLYLTQFMELSIYMSIGQCINCTGFAQFILTIYIVVKLATIVEGDPKAPFSIATTPRCTGGRYSIPRIAPLYPWTVPYNAEC